MSEFTRTRRVIALLAAYGLALQALLSPLSLAAASPFDASLCAADAGARDRAGGPPSQPQPANSARAAPSGA